MEVILLFIGGVVLFVGICWFFGEVVRPLRQLQRLIRELAAGEKIGRASCRERVS
jgi:hypothetical protein